MRPNVVIAKRQKIPAAYSLLMLSWTMAFRLRAQSERERRGEEGGWGVGGVASVRLLMENQNCALPHMMQC